MYIFRWLMKHPVIILALYFLSIVAILFSMTGGGSSSDNKIDGSLVKEGSVSNYFKEHGVDLSNAPTIEPSSLTTALVTENNSEGVTNTEVNQIAETKDIVTDATVASTVSTEESSKENNVVDTTTENASDATTVATTETAEVATDTASIVEDAETATQFSEMNEEELLLMAREAYWNNGLEESAQIYQQLIELSPSVIDYQGELGNVYWRQGFPKKAAELYAAISLPMLEAGDAERVANMVGFIGLFYPEKATELHNRLQADK